LSGLPIFRATGNSRLPPEEDRNNRPRDLSPFPNSDAEWINASEQIVGKVASSNFSVQIAALWENGNPAVDLNTLIPPGSNLLVTEARNINDGGEISFGAVDSDGNSRAFLLIPCDEKHAGIDGCDYSLVDAVAATNAVGSQPVAQNPTTANPWVSGTANPMMCFFGHRSMPWYRNLEVQPPSK